MTTLSIILAFLLGVAVMVSALHYRNYKRACGRKAVLERKVKNLELAQEFSSPVYVIRDVLDLKNGGYKEYCEVVRLSNIEGHLYTTLIKSFTDDDNDYNHREAEELCDKLNEK